MKPPALRAGARLGIVSPASTPKAHLVQSGMERLQQLGYEPVLFPSALAGGPLYYAGDVVARVADLHAAFQDKSIDAILCTRGGWGTAELLPHLDAGIVRANPKPFLGFSDHTTLHLWFAQACGLGTFYAPMLTPDFARGETVANGVDLASWNAALTQSDPWSIGAERGLRLLRSGKSSQAVSGTLFGGCLTLLVESLGTPYALEPPPGDGILFLEEVGTKPYQWDRMLVHLRYAGVLDRVVGIVFGDMEQCLTATDDAEAMQAERTLLENALLHSLRDFDGPIAIGLQSGHVNTPNVTLPLNVPVELDCTADPTLRILEAAVTL